MPKSSKKDSIKTTNKMLVGVIVLLLILVGYFLIKQKFDTGNKVGTKVTTEMPADWKEYGNSTYTFSYPQNLNIKESEDVLLMSNKTINGYPDDEIQYEVYVKRNSDGKEFAALLNADPNEDVIEAHHAVSMIVTKLANTEVDGYQAISYFTDGMSSKEEKSRGPIGYSYHTQIKVDETTYIDIWTSSFDRNTVEMQKKVYDDMLKSFKIKKY